MQIDTIPPVLSRGPLQGLREKIEAALSGQSPVETDHRVKPPLPLTVVGDDAYIPLTKGLVAVIDVADIPLVERFRWYARPSRGTAYAISTCGGHGRQRAYLHQTILGVHGQTVDHIDGDGLNNRRSNLRLASTAENAHNTGARITNQLGVKGVVFDKRRRKFIARIRYLGRQRHIGSYLTLEAAAEAYAVEAKRLHGSFANTAPLAGTPTAEYQDLVDALALMIADYDSSESRHGRRMIGLGDTFSYPSMPRAVKSLEDARAVLERNAHAHPDRIYEIRNSARGEARS